MKIGGIQKLSLIDYPGRISATLFVQGCPFRCPFCHNPELVLPLRFKKPLDTGEVLKFLLSRQNKLQAVVISGGEPTIFAKLPDFIYQIKKLGFLIKLDTSGIIPSMLKNLLKANLLDYVAMDIKSSLGKYSEASGRNINTSLIKESIELLRQSGISHEFRTTLVDSLHTLEDIREMSRLIEGAPLYFLQSFNPGITLKEDYSNKKAPDHDFLQQALLIAQKYVKTVKIR